MSKCVFRMDIRQRPVGDPLLCIDAIEMFDRPGMPTVEQCVPRLLTEDEICLGASDKRAIMQGPKVVGYIRILAQVNSYASAVARRDADGR
jgi:hypothetical protein